MSIVLRCSSFDVVVVALHSSQSVTQSQQHDWRTHGVCTAACSSDRRLSVPAPVRPSALPMLPRYTSGLSQIRRLWRFVMRWAGKLVGKTVFKGFGVIVKFITLLHILILIFELWRQSRPYVVTHRGCIKERCFSLVVILSTVFIGQ